MQNEARGALLVAILRAWPLKAASEAVAGEGRDGEGRNGGQGGCGREWIQGQWHKLDHFPSFCSLPAREIAGTTPKRPISQQEAYGRLRCLNSLSLWKPPNPPLDEVRSFSAQLWVGEG